MTCVEGLPSHPPYYMAGSANMFLKMFIKMSSQMAPRSILQRQKVQNLGNLFFLNRFENALSD